MGKKVIKIELSERGINDALKQLDEYKKDLIRKTTLLRERVASEIADRTKTGFAGAVVDDLLRGGAKLAQVDVVVKDSGNVSIVIANGEDAVWVEFGAGVYHNKNVGSSPHPKGSELGFTIGDYGKGMGKLSAWGFYDDGELRVTRGTPATMPMYTAARAVCEIISDLAKEIFA